MVPYVPAWGARWKSGGRKGMWHEALGSLICALLSVMAATAAAANTAPAEEQSHRVPAFDHIVVVMMENKDYSNIIGKERKAPYINLLAAKGALMTKYMALTHPSLPNYLALYAGTTFDIIDDDDHVLLGPTLATVLRKAGKTFRGYVERPEDTDSHNPWTAFPEHKSVERDFTDFPAGNFDALPHVSFVIPNVDNDMHDGSITQGDSWLRANFESYAEWAKANNSLLIVLWDETDEGDPNHVAAIFYGAHVKPGLSKQATNHYNMLATILAAHELTGPLNAATAVTINVFGDQPLAPPRVLPPPERGPRTTHDVPHPDRARQGPRDRGRVKHQVVAKAPKPSAKQANATK